MAVDKLVDSTQLDADLTSVANAIRTKGGTSAQMAFPAGFVSAVNAIPTVAVDFKYETGSFVLDSDIIDGPIQHTLGVVPKAVIVWQESITQADLPLTYQVNCGQVYLDGIMGIKQRLTSAVSSDFGFLFHMYITANSENVFMFAPSSASYMPDENTKPTESLFYLYKSGSAYKYRAGVQYHYFVSEAWWE